MRVGLERSGSERAASLRPPRELKGEARFKPGPTWFIAASLRPMVYIDWLNLISNTLAYYVFILEMPGPCVLKACTAAPLSNTYPPAQNITKV